MISDLGIFGKYNIENINDVIEKRLSFGVPWEGYLSLILSGLNIHSNVLDIGGCLGTFSIFVKKNFDTRVICFEASKKNFTKLNRNILLNNIHIHSENLAISEKAENVYFSDYPSNNLGKSSIVKSKSSQLINAISLDDYDKRLDKVSLVKIDVEGHEFSVIKGMKKFFLNYRCLIILETKNMSLLNLITKKYNYIALYLLRSDYILIPL